MKSAASKIKFIKRELQEIETTLPDALPVCIGMGFDDAYVDLDWLIEAIEELTQTDSAQKR